jgi:hypothetical protein
MGLVQRIDGSVVKYITIKTEYDIIWGVEGKAEFMCKAGMCNTACFIHCSRVGKYMWNTFMLTVNSKGNCVIEHTEA